MKVNVLLISVIAFSTLVFYAKAQSIGDSIQANINYRMADSLLEVGKYEHSQKYALLAVELFEKNEQWSELVDALNTASENNWRLGKLNKGKEYAEKAREISQSYLGKDHLSEANALNNLGNIKIMQGKLSESLLDHNAALRIKKIRLDADDPGLAGAYSNIGVIHDYLGEYNEALEYYKAALTIDEKVVGGKQADLAMSYNNIASIYELKGDSRKALKYYQRALEIDVELFGDNHPDVAAIYSNIGTIHDLNGSHDLANDYFSKALRIRENIFGEDHPAMADSYNNIGIVLYERNDFDRALDYYQKALKIREATLGDKHMKIINVLYNIARVYWGKGNNEVALEHYLRALELSRQNASNNHPDIAKTHGHLGRFYSDIGDLDQALFHFSSSLKIYKENFGEYHPEIIRMYNGIASVYVKKKLCDEAMVNVNLAFKANASLLDEQGSSTLGYGSRIILNTIRLKAEIFRLKYAENGEIKDLNAAIESYQKCDSLIDVMRKENLRHADRVYVSSVAADIYDNAVATTKLLFDETNDSKHSHQAFYFGEKNKGVVLSLSLIDQHAKSYSGIPEGYLEVERNLSIDESFYKSEILKIRIDGEQMDSSKMESYQNRLFSIKRQSDSLKKSLEEQFPEYFELKYSNTTLTVEEIQNGLSSDQALIEFMETDSSVFTFVILKEDFWIESFKKNEGYTLVLDQYIGSLDIDLISKNQKQAFDQYGAGASKLYEILIHPVVNKLSKNVSRLIIVPDGKLSYVPLDILLTSAPANEDYKSMHYLLNDYAISYAHSASHLFSKVKSNPRSSESVLAFAPSYSNEQNLVIYENLGLQFRDELIPLQWNEAEIDEIENHFPGSYFKGSDATEGRFKQKAKDYQILHLAMHAFIDNQNPMLSKFVFSQKEDSVDDGMLHAYELFNMNLSAEMAVLSACKTGIGKTQKGEGVMSLGKAFSYAGCQSVIMSHWSVDDKSTSKLMNSFYQFIANGESKDQAMRFAKIQYLKESHGVSTHPYYWGGFVTLGNSDPLTTSGEGHWIIIVIIGFVVVIGSFIYWRNQGN